MARFRDELLLASLIALAALILLRGLGNDSLGFPDADRILMDSVFLRDLLVDLPLADPIGYTKDYFVQYPALSIGYRPPFFPFVAALLQLLVGPEMWATRLALFGFVLVGVASSYFWIRRHYGPWPAWGATALWLTTPYLAQWGWYTMAELTVLSMALLAANLFDKYLAEGKPALLYWSVLAVALAAWTKQTALFLLPWFAAMALAEGRFLAILRRREAWIAAFGLGVLLAPLVAMTLMLGDLNLEQSVGGTNRWTLANWTVRLKTILHHLTPPLLALSVVGAIWAGLKRDRHGLPFALLIVVVYGVFSYISGKNDRYPIFWVPAFALFAVLPFHFLSQRLPAKATVPALALGVGVLAAYQGSLAFTKTPSYATGYKEAAAYVLDSSETPIVFVDAYNNGYFTYFTRALDQGRSMVVLRGDKLLSSSAINMATKVEVHAEGRQEIEEIFRSLGVSLIVVEERNYTGLDVHDELRRFLKTDSFELVQAIPIHSNRTVSVLADFPPLGGQDLLVYRYKDAKTLTSGVVSLRLPVVGQTLSVDMETMMERRRAHP